LQGFSQNRDKPVKINAAELEVHDKDKMAVFSGDVHLVQGDTDMRSSTLVVYYDDQPPAPPPPKSGKGAKASAQITPQQNQQIKRVEAKGSVRVMQKSQNQIANGDEGIFDMRSNTVTMQGHVVISQGPQVLRGDRLTVNMNTGDSAMTCDTPKGQAPCRVTGLFDPSAMKQGQGGGGLPTPGRKP
jgi:lipopolysaccharide export system protein LptA